MKEKWANEELWPFHVVGVWESTFCSAGWMSGEGYLDG